MVHEGAWASTTRREGQLKSELTDSSATSPLRILEYILDFLVTTKGKLISMICDIDMSQTQEFNNGMQFNQILR